MDGYQVLPMREAARVGDIFVTATGCRDVVRGEHFDLMKDGAVLANAGHFNVEINLPELAARAVERRPARQNVEEFVLSDGRRLYLLGEGRLVNLACGDGHPIEIMDLSFALQALAIQYVDQHAGELAPGVHRVPAELDRRVAELKLASLGVEIDRLSEEQQEYLASWGE